jgi:hypothetical protein
VGGLGVTRDGYGCLDDPYRHMGSCEGTKGGQKLPRSINHVLDSSLRPAPSQVGIIPADRSEMGLCTCMRTCPETDISSETPPVHENGATPPVHEAAWSFGWLVASWVLV